MFLSLQEKHFFCKSIILEASMCLLSFKESSLLFPLMNLAVCERSCSQKGLHFPSFHSSFTHKEFHFSPLFPSQKFLYKPSFNLQIFLNPLLNLIFPFIWFKNPSFHLSEPPNSSKEPSKSLKIFIFALRP